MADYQTLDSDGIDIYTFCKKLCKPSSPDQQIQTLLHELIQQYSELQFTPSAWNVICMHMY